MSFRWNFSLLVFMMNFSVFSQNSADDFSFPAPENSLISAPLTLWSTQYYIHEFRSGGTIPIRYSNGESSGLFADTCDFCSASLEGTAYVTDSIGNITVINFARSGDSSFVDCRACKKVCFQQIEGGKLGENTLDKIGRIWRWSE